ncbi:MAG: nucleotidyl transferase AbiEii/AbiGii toxin family protein [Candidatus Zapsychrus exili]|nr:nucleotidyl transferase AbiEii/AbiGii toxin family protein [Candidatus Zapsychrus exili]
MSVDIIQDRLRSYNCQNLQEEEHALREMTQEVILAGLARSDFFKYAEFHGGTSLRIFHGTNRFSEDLDFVLMKQSADFSLEKYIQAAVRELDAYGYQFEITDKSKATSVVKKAFIKDDSIGKILEFDYIQVNPSMKKIKIKLEVDTNPPQGSGYVSKYLTFPFPASIRVHDKESLFAGKMHALLCREYIKGRDWYDLIWFCTNRVDVNYGLLSSALNQSGPWEKKGVIVSNNWCFDELRKKIESLNWDDAKNDIYPFVRDYERPSIEVWSKEFFLDLVGKYLQEK